jgi:WD40 repeat protein
VFSAHQQTIRAVVWSPDGKQIASGGDDHLLLFWQPDGTLLATLSFGGPVHALAWSPDGAQIAVGNANTVFFVDTQTRRVLDAHTYHTAPVTALGWTPLTQAGASLAISGSRDTTAVVWQAMTHQPLLTFRAHTAPILALSVLSDLVATASEGGVVRVWQAARGQEVHGYFSEDPQAVRAVAFSSAGLLAVGGDDQLIHLWLHGSVCQKAHPTAFGVRCLDPSQYFQGNAGPVRAVAFSPDGSSFAVGGDDHHVQLRSSTSLQPILTKPAPTSILALSWSVNSQLATASGTQVTIWQQSS